MKEISIIGVTGSIGQQTLAVVRRHKDQFRIKSMVANSSCNDFLAAVEEFKPEYAALVNESVGRRIKNKIPAGVKFACGIQAALDALNYGDTAVIAATGFAGLEYSLEAAKRGKNIALANKETLVCGGELMMSEVKKAGVQIMPVDSEHSALWQALGFSYDTPFKKLILTASGGPFYGYSKAELEKVTVKEALNHPTWKMGQKITIDSATLLNKGFEVIEASVLYNAPLEKIQTVVQPESIIHSMVEFEDGGILAQMSYPSMELPIQLALTYPDRLKGNVKSLDFSTLSSIRFLPLERKKFHCYHLALCAMEDGDNYPCALNAAGEVAVRAFLDKKISFTGIGEVIEEVLGKNKRKKANSFEALVETDLKARSLAETAVKRRTK
ncbi:MAG: 1-deoxy-D-xylulose-5-phosphate reductoisomerase [Clostridia bacterium]|nr:1-deoxy-D-xylulose-5-phosphate reductoisomerase [Clostridia bacterium]